MAVKETATDAGKLLVSPAHNELIRTLVVPRLVPARRLAPRCHGMPAARSLSFTAAMRMVYRVHRYTAVVRTLTQPPRPSGFADRHILVIDVADLPDRRHAVLRNLARLARRQLHQRVLFFLRYELRRTTSRSHHLSALAGFQFQIVNNRTWWNITQRQCVTNENVGLGPAQHLLPNLQSLGLQNVALLAIGICQQRDARRAVRIVLDRRHRRRDAGLIALEVDNPQLALVAATDKPHRRVARVAPSARTRLRFDQRFMRMLRRDVVVD